MSTESLQRAAQMHTIVRAAGAAVDSFVDDTSIPSGGLDVSIFSDQDAVRKLWAVIKGNPDLVRDFEELLGEDPDGKKLDEDKDGFQDGILPFFRVNSTDGGGNIDSNGQIISVDELNKGYERDESRKNNVIMMIKAGIALAKEAKTPTAAISAEAEAARTAAAKARGDATTCETRVSNTVLLLTNGTKPSGDAAAAGVVAGAAEIVAERNALRGRVGDAEKSTVVWKWVAAIAATTALVASAMALFGRRSRGPAPERLQPGGVKQPRGAAPRPAARPEPVERPGVQDAIKAFEADAEAGKIPEGTGAGERKGPPPPPARTGAAAPPPPPPGGNSAADALAAEADRLAAAERDRAAAEREKAAATEREKLAAAEREKLAAAERDRLAAEEAARKAAAAAAKLKPDVPTRISGLYTSATAPAGDLTLNRGQIESWLRRSRALAGDAERMSSAEGKAKWGGQVEKLEAALALYEEPAKP